MTYLQIPAIEFRQGQGRRLYTFVINGKRIPLFASISRIRRENGQKLIGYQRTQVFAHIAEIRRYIDSQNPMIPNAIVIAFDESVSFTPTESSPTRSEGRNGNLSIPVYQSEPGAKCPGWIVDGQQRMAAIQDAQIDFFPVCVVGFIAENQNDEREQFIRVNSAKPLPKDLIDELITETNAVFDANKERRRLPLEIRNRLNYDDDSPFRGRIKTPTVPAGFVSSSSVLRMIENSLSNGVLFRFLRLSCGRPDLDGIMLTLTLFWHAVATTFHDAWENSPTKSRLTHGAGIISLGYVMDAICGRYAQKAFLTQEEFAQELSTIASACAWTTGEWKFSGGGLRKWNDLQNTPKDIELLAHHLLSRYRGDS